MYEPHRDAWAAGGVLPSSLPFADGAPRGGGGAAVVGGSLHCSTVLLCDHGGSGFITGPSMARPRVHSAVASVAGTVYVLVSPYMSYVASKLPVGVTRASQSQALDMPHESDRKSWIRAGGRGAARSN